MKFEALRGEVRNMGLNWFKYFISILLTFQKCSFYWNYSPCRIDIWKTICCIKKKLHPSI